MEHNHLRRRIIGTFADGFYCKPGLLLEKEFLARFPCSLFRPVSVTSELPQRSSDFQMWHTENSGWTWFSDVKAAVVHGEFLPSALVFLRTLVGFNTALQFTLVTRYSKIGEFVWLTD